jgi:hypothetical protein
MVSTLDQANQLSYSLILANVLVECSFSVTPLTLKLFYAENMNWRLYIKVIKWILECFPTYSFSLGFGLMSMIASKRFNYNTVNWVDGSHFGLKEYYWERRIVVTTTNDVMYPPSVAYCVNCLIYTTIFFVVAFWYFDHILSSNRGVAYSMLFPFTKKYWISVFPFLASKKKVETDAES